MPTTQSPSKQDIKEYFEAAANGDIKTVCAFSIKFGAEFVDITDSRGQTALMFAAMYGQTSTARFLAINFADLDKKSEYLWTAVMAAQWYGNTEIVNLLGSYGADTSAPNPRETTPTHGHMIKNGSTTEYEIIRPEGKNLPRCKAKF